MTDILNLLLKTFKQANPNLKHEKAQERVKECLWHVKYKPDLEKLALEKITELKHEGIQKRQKNTFLSFRKKAKPLVSTSSINTVEQTEPDVEILVVELLVSLLLLKWPQIVLVTSILNESLPLFTRWHGEGSTLK